MQRPFVQLAVLSASVVLFAAAPRAAAAQVVANLVVSGLASPGTEQRAPAAAFDGTNHLLVWEEAGVIWGIVLDPGGAAIAAPFPVASPAEPNAPQATPAVAAAPAGGFLVAWAEAAAASGWNIRGARVSSTGTVLDASGFDISTVVDGTVTSLAPGAQELPAVAANGSDFLVVWQDGRATTGAPDVFGTEVVAGTVLEPSGVAISQGEGAQRRPAAASNGAGYLVVWEDVPATGVADVFGSQLDAATGLPSAAFAISAAAGDQLQPSVASNGAEYAVLWNDQRSEPAWQLVAARVGDAGVLAADVNGVLVAAIDGNAPHAIASDGFGYLALFERGAAALGARFSASGATSLDFTIDSSGVVPPGQALAYSTSGRYLAVHRDGASGTGQLSVWLVTTVERLDVLLAGTGAGTVLSSPAGIDCGATCSASFATGTQVQLTATATSGVLQSWTGCDAASGTTCTVGLSGPRTVEASFLAEPGAAGGPSYTALGATSLTASWTAAEGATLHELERAPDTATGPGTYALVIALAGTVHQDTGLSSNATYWYRVRGTNDAGAGQYGTATSVTTLPGVVAAAPTFSAILADSVTVSWTAPDGGAEAYELERATSGGTDWTPVDGVAGLSHTDAALAPGTEYLYRVRAVNGSGAGAYSATASVTTLPLPPGAPAAPTYSAVAATSVTVAWDSVAGATSYDLERGASDAGTWTVVASDVTDTSRVDGAVTANATYWYRVRATNSGGDSAYSTASSVTTLPDAPGAPTFDAISTTSVRVSWSAPEGGATAYELERADDASGSPGTFVPLTTELAGTTYTDPTLAGGTRYWYRVRARASAGLGAYSVNASVTTAPAAPGAPTYANIASGSVTVSWPAVQSATGYELERAPDTATGAGTYAPVIALAGTTHQDTGLSSNATYWYRVRATSPSGDGPYSGESSVLTLPGAAGKPTFGTLTATSVTVSWTDPTGGAATYSVERAPATTGTWAAIATGLTAFTFDDAGLAPGTTYAYRIVARNDSGAGAPSESASVATVPDAPAAPTFTSATTTSLTVSWTAVTGATSYSIERAPAETGPWTELQAGLTALAYTDSGLVAGTTYSYRVRARNDSGSGAYSASGSAATLPDAPGAPAFTSVTASSVTVSWSAVTGATSYELERAPASGGVAGTWARVGTVATTTFDDAPLASNATYWYRVRAVNGSGAGAYSAERSVLTSVAAPGTPTFSAATTTSLTVSWTAPAGGAASYSIERAPAATGTWTELKAGLTALAYTDSGLDAGTTYWYRVLARNASGVAYSASNSAPTLPLAPAAPSFTNVTASTLTVSWAPVVGATSYKVERAPDAAGAPGTTWTQIAAGVTATSRADTGRTGNTVYWYRVRATNASGDSAYSPAASVLTLPGTPGTPSFSAYTTTSLTVSWAAPAGGAASYEVERAESATGPWTQIASALTSLTFADSGLSAGTTYSYRVRGTNAAGTGSYSAVASVPTLPAAPEAPTFTSITASSLTVSWPAVTGATRYKVERAPDAGGAAGTWAQIAQDLTATSYADTGRAANTTYWYRVRAGNASGDGAYSAASKVLTLPGVPGTPNFTAVTDTSVSLAWSAPTGGADTYDVERATAAVGPWTLVATGVAGVSYDDATLEPGVKYWYRVRGVNATGAGGWSASASMTALPDASGAPWFTGVSTVSLTVNWTPTAGATTYHVERAPDVAGAPGGWAPVATGILDPYFNDAVAANTKYWYRVRGANTTGFGEWSPASSVTTLANEASDAPTFSNVTDTSLTVSWAAPSGGAASYVVERATSSGGPWAIVASGVTALSYDDLALSPETTYWYRVRSTNSAGETGTPSSIAAVTTLSARPSAAPGAPTFGAVGTASVAVAWTPVADATSYKLERALDAAGAPGAWAQLATLAVTTYTDGAVGPNTRYWYRVRASSAGGDGPYSAASAVVTLPNAPGTPTFSAIQARALTLSWTAPAGGVASYLVERSASDRPWATVAAGVTTTSYTDTGLTASSVYYYRVRGTNAAGQSGAASAAGLVATSPDEVKAPEAPGTPTYSSVSATALTVSWAAALGAESYALDRATDASGAPGAWTQIASVTTLTHRDTGRTANTVYWYRVRATSATATTAGGASSVMTAPSAPGAPAFAAIGATALTVSWTAPPEGAATYALERAASSIGPWMQVGSGIAVTSFEDAGLTGNTTYHYRVRATNAAGLVGAYSASRSVTTAADTSTPLPGSPGAPTYSNITATYLKVSWTVAADATSHELERAAASSGPWVRIAATTATSFTDTGRTANTAYWYRVRGSNARGPGPYSPETGTMTAPDAPGAPTFSSIGSTTVTVSWTAPAGGAASYKLERATSVVGPWTIAASGVTTLVYADSGLAPYTTYHYRVRATSSTGADGASSASRSVLTASDSTAPPGQPGTPAYPNVTATYVKVSWIAAAGATSHELERAAAPDGPWTAIAQTTATSFTDTGTSANTTYSYRVRGANGGGYGPYSAASSVTTAPAAPGSPTFSSIGSTTMTVGWTAPAGGAASYKVERATSVVGPWVIAASGVTGLSYADSGLASYTTYHYRVRGANSAGVDGASSASSSVVTAADPNTAAPGAPGTPSYANVTATYVAVSWGPAPNATSYELERADAGGSWSRIATTTATSFTDSGRSANTKYWYRVRGSNGGGYGPYSGTSGVTTAPNAPGAPELTAVTSSALTVTWAAPVGGAATYKLERAASSVGPWTVVASGLTAQSYGDSGLAGYTTYHYRVRGTNSEGVDGLASYSASVTTEPDGLATLPGAPGVPVFSSVNATWLTVSWSAATDATSYELERATAADGPFALVATPTTTSFGDTGRTGNTRYWYRVAGANAGGTGPWSEARSVVTAPGAPGAPTFGSVEATTLVVSWTAPVGGAASYRVERATSSIGPWTEIAAGVTGLSLADSGLTAGTTYSYRLRGANVDGLTGAYSVVKSVTTAAAVPAM